MKKRNKPRLRSKETKKQKTKHKNKKQKINKKKTYRDRGQKTQRAAIKCRLSSPFKHDAKQLKSKTSVTFHVLEKSTLF